jgi:hypothetical protein
MPQGLPRSCCRGIGFEDLRTIVIGGCAGGDGLLRRHQRAVAHLRGEATAPVDPNQEMIGLGAANLAAGCSRAFRSAAAPRARRSPRPPGAKTQMTGVVGALAVALLCWWRPNLCRTCPTARWPRW